MTADKQKPLVIWGAAGHAKVLAEFAGDLGFQIAAFFDTRPVADAPVPGVAVYIGRHGFESWRRSFAGEAAGLVAIGGWRGAERCEIHDYMASQGVSAVTMVHPRGWVARTAVMGPGCQVLAQAAVAAGAILGRSCIVNTGASVDHECWLGDGVHVAPGARVAGCVVMEDFSFVGVGAVVLPRLRIGRNAIIGAGAVVTRDVPPGKVVLGNPARIVRDKEAAI